MTSLPISLQLLLLWRRCHANSVCDEHTQTERLRKMTVIMFWSHCFCEKRSTDAVCYCGSIALDRTAALIVRASREQPKSFVGQHRYLPHWFTARRSVLQQQPVTCCCLHTNFLHVYRPTGRKHIQSASGSIHSDTWTFCGLLQTNMIGVQWGQTIATAVNNEDVAPKRRIILKTCS